MKKLKWKTINLLLLIFLVLIFGFIYFKSSYNGYLNFSDGAKYADIARNISQGNGYTGNFNFFLNTPFSHSNYSFGTSSFIQPLMPISMTAMFKLFGINDFAVIAASFFYFLLTLIFVYLLAKKIFNSSLIGFISTVTVGLNINLINYAAGGASESPFIFEIVAGLYFASMKKKWGNIIAGILLILMYFTRPQAFIYIAGVILYYLLLNFSIKKASIYFCEVILVGIIADRFLLSSLAGKYFLYSIIDRGSRFSFNQSGIASDALRGANITAVSVFQTLKNVFYNLYNFYKLLPDILSPYLFVLFVLGIIIPDKDKRLSAFKIASIFIITLTFIVTALTIPFFRYLHPIIPLIYILATGTLVVLMKLAISKNKRLLVMVTIFLIFLFGVGQTLGVLLLDSRFDRNTHNVGKPPVYVVLSRILKENTSASDIVVTNLDTWGSWYGERKTVWYPLEPKQLIDPATGKIPFKAIYLTSYLMDDPNYYMGSAWREIFENPRDSTKWLCNGCQDIANNFKLKGVYSVYATEDYERLDAKAILLIKND